MAFCQKPDIKKRMKARFNHFNINVLDTARSVKFYSDALGLSKESTYEADDGSFVLTYLKDSESSFRLELTCLLGRKEPYNLGDNESHLCFSVSGDYSAWLAKHKKMGCVCFENNSMGIYFIEDPDGYWIEIVPEKI